MGPYVVRECTLPILSNLWCNFLTLLFCKCWWACSTFQGNVILNFHPRGEIWLWYFWAGWVIFKWNLQKHISWHLFDIVPIVTDHICESSLFDLLELLSREHTRILVVEPISVSQPLELRSYETKKCRAHPTAFYYVLKYASNKQINMVNVFV